MKYIKNINWYKATCITVALLLTIVMYVYGVPALLDDVAQWRNGGMPTEDARCASAFKLKMD